MKKIYLLTVVLLLSAISGFSQTNLRAGRILKSEKNNKNKEIEKITILQSSPIVNNDTLYCTSTKKQNGWFAPLDTISKEMALHRNHSVRFTNKNKAGNWTRIESIDGYGNYVKGAISPYILKLSSYDTDKDANEEWIEKLKTTCICELIADYSGKVIVQERAYDESMNLVYSYSRVPIGNKQYIGSYKDSYGLPAEMRNDEEYTYGTLVKITEDRYGYDSIIQYMDSKGVPKLNSDGVAMEVYINDEYGHLIKQQSRNADGTLTIDNWGNCGIEYEWNDKHEIISATYMNDKWQPMPLPGNRETTGRENVIRTNYKYDEYKRQYAEYYTDSEGNPLVNKLGTHKIICKVNDKGDVIERRGYNKDNDLSPVDLSGDAVEVFEYNKNGQCLSSRFYDKDQKPNSKEGYLCRIDREYDNDGNEISVKRYIIKNGIEKLVSSKQLNNNYIYTLWNNGECRVDSLDSKDRTTYVGFYDVTGNPVMSEGRSYERYKYIDDGLQTTVIETYYDDKGHPAQLDGRHKKIRIIDSVRFIEQRMIYDSTDFLKESYIMQWNKDFSKVLAEYDANAYGVVSRSGGTSSVRHYIGGVVYNQKNKFATLVGRDEFGEADYITSNTNTYYYSKLHSKSDTRFFDENNSEIEDLYEFRDSLPKVMTIEIVDSIAYSRGLRDNDVILLYGDYSVNLNKISSFFKFRRDWALRTILDARKNKRMVVFRIENASENQYGLVEIDNLEGTPSDLGFLAHIRYLTKKQTNRIKEAIEVNINSDNPIVSESDFCSQEPDDGHYVIMAVTEMFRSNRDKPYARQITDPAILLGACIKDKGMYWDIAKGEDMQIFESMLDSRNKQTLVYPRMDYYLTTDMDSVSHLLLEDQSDCTNWFDTKISDKDYALLLELNKSVKMELKKKQKISSKYKANDFVATWEILPDEKNSYSLNGTLQLLKTGESIGSIVNYGMITYKEGTIFYRIETDYSGKWQYHGGDFITFSPNKEDNITLSCIDFIGADMSLRERAIKYQNSICEERKSFLLENMEFFNNSLGNDMLIKDVGKQRFIVEDGGDTGVLFIKAKSKLTQNKANKTNDVNPLR